jgi:hypothetical protein
LAGEVRRRFRRAGEDGSTVQHDIVLLLALPVALLASEALVIPTLLALVACHGWMGLRIHQAPAGGVISRPDILGQVRSLSVVVAASVLSTVPTGVLAVLGL